jgi:hypothetical protein
MVLGNTRGSEVISVLVVIGQTPKDPKESFYLNTLGTGSG